MKKIIRYIPLLIIALSIASCEDNAFVLDYTAPLTIDFTGVDNTNIVTVDKGVMSYNAKIEVKAQGTKIKYFEIYTADTRTGARGDLIENTAIAFDEGVPSYSTEYTIDNLTGRKRLKCW